MYPSRSVAVLVTCQRVMFETAPVRWPIEMMNSGVMWRLAIPAAQQTKKLDTGCECFHMDYSVPGLDEHVTA